LIQNGKKSRKWFEVKINRDFYFIEEKKQIFEKKIKIKKKERFFWRKT